MKFSSNRKVDSAKNLELKNSSPIHIAYLDMKPKSSQVQKSHGALGSIRKKGSNNSVSSDASVVRLKASNKVNARRVMDPEQLQAFRMIQDGISEMQKKVMVRLLQALIDVYEDKDCRRVVIRYIEDLLNNLDQANVTNFLQVLHGLSARAIAEGRCRMRDRFLSEILLINEDNEDEDKDKDKDEDNENDNQENVNLIMIEEANKTDIEVISEASTLGTYNVSPFSNESFDPNCIFDEETSNA